ncbi:MAG: iron ABC transporter permease [Burkholderiaceae bacterium]|jgi:iron complex transport system permease protein
MRRVAGIWLLLALAAGVVGFIALSVGSAGFDAATAWKALFVFNHPAHDLIVRLRLPRISSGFVVGALLSTAGALLQLLLRNPLAEPYVLGLSGGAALGALAALTLAASSAWVGVAAALGALVSLGVLLLVAAREFRVVDYQGAGERLLLSGVMLAALWGALITLLLSISEVGRMQALIFWLMGELSGAQGGVGAWLALVFILLAAAWDAPRLNILLRGDDVAAALGIHVGALKRRVVILSALAAGCAVAIAGTVGFVGLVAPHLVRVLWGNDQRMLLPASALLGGTAVILADTVARTIVAPQQLPVGAVTAALGAPLFLYLLWRERR